MPTGIIDESSRPVLSRAGIFPASPAPADVWFETTSVSVPAFWVRYLFPAMTFLK